MKNFKLEKEEELIKILKNIQVEADENQYELTLFLTSKRIVLLKDCNKELEYNEFLSSRLVSIPENLEVVFDMNFNKIKEAKYLNGVNVLTFKENNHVLKIYCENIIATVKGE